MTSRQYTTNTNARRFDGQKKNHTTTTPAAPTPFCKVCKDAGLSVDVYTNHFVKDQPGPNGRVVCPTLLNQSCRICNKPGHTSSYCPQYKPRRDDRYQQQQQQEREESRRREDHRYIEREPRREERYQRNDISYNTLRGDTERHEREIEERNHEYHREQDRRSKPWLQAALKETSSSNRVPYAHPHGPRVRLTLDSPALSVANHAEPEPELLEINAGGAAAAAEATINVRTVQLNHSSNWGDEDVAPFVYNPALFAQEFLQSSFVTDAELDFIDACDNYSGENCFPDSPRSSMMGSNQ